MKIDPKLVEQWALDVDLLPNFSRNSIAQLNSIAQRAADHALEEAAKAFEAEADESASSSLARHYRDSAKFLRAMKGTK